MSKEVSDGDRRKGAAKPYFGRLFPRRSHSTLPHSESPKVTERYSETEDASARFWAIYISEAERYDSALIESWKADMSGMLIFSGLFSASLTAFLIESYKNLIPNSGDMTVTLLSQVSQQLNAMSSGTSLPIPSSPPPFKIDTSSLVCNAFWFLSLGLSLTCALLATLVEQWAREFMHKTEMRPSPVRRARVFSFLYYGVSRFRMHAIVDIIPMLLHLALVLFLSGLVAFLLPINRIMTALVASILAAFLAFYCVLTVIPVIALDCPYRTPLSGIFWRIVQRFCYLIQRPFTDRSLTEAVLAAAMQKRSTRDERAVLWTLESLTDDRELLPFVEAIPDMIYGPSGLRRVDDHLFRLVLQTADAHTSISGRIFALLRSSENLHPEDPWRSRRQIAALAALWALGILVPRITIAPMEAVFWIDHTNLSSLHIPAEYRTSLIALAKYIRLKNIQNRFQELHNLFAVHDLSKIRDRRRVAHVLSGSVDRLRRDVDAYRVKIPSTTYVLGVLAHAAALDPADTAHETWEISRRALSELNNEEMWLPHFSQIAFELLRDSFYAGSAAYRLLVTCREILPMGCDHRPRPSESV
ncbi:hypothetical protein C8J57DRAFT_281241 [Mycena rebaudengoi]|nr:hypothetical protein C8J57DRAFT_281241 [Mycena rebaudengoi]